MPRTWRKKVAKNIFEDDSGYEIIIQRHGRKNPPARYKKDTTLGFLKSERDRLLDDLTKKAERFAPGTLHADTEAYLKTLPKGRMKADRTNELAPWLITWGPWQRDKITSQIVRGQLAQWESDGLAPSTINHRRQALRSLYRALDGLDAKTPCDDVHKLTERRTIRDLPQAVVVAILRRLPKTKNGARIKVIARTGLPHATLGRLEASDFHPKQRTLHVAPRRKGKGTKARTLPLTHAAVRAFKLMARYEAWGPFSNSSLHKVFQRAVKEARAKWPKGKPWPAPAKIRPYDLRHAFGTEVYRRTKDLRATAELMLHANMTMTARYAEAAVSDTAAAARDAMDRKMSPRRKA